MNKKLALLTAVVSVIVTTIVVAGVTSATDEGGVLSRFRQKKMNPEKQEQMKEQQIVMKEIMDNGDYNAWKEFVSQRPMGEKKLEVMTEEKFNQMKQVHDLMQAGKVEEAKALREELGLQGSGMRKRGGMYKFNKDRQFKDVNGDGVCDRSEQEVKS